MLHEFCNCEWILIVPSDKTNTIDSHEWTKDSSWMDENMIEEEESKDSEEKSNSKSETPETDLTVHFVEEWVVD